MSTLYQGWWFLVEMWICGEPILLSFMRGNSFHDNKFLGKEKKYIMLPASVFTLLWVHLQKKIIKKTFFSFFISQIFRIFPYMIRNLPLLVHPVLSSIHEGLWLSEAVYCMITYANYMHKLMYKQKEEQFVASKVVLGCSFILSLPFEV